MRYVIEGTVKRGGSSGFTVEVEAKSEKHAKELALIKVGAKSKVGKTQIEIKKVAQKK